MAATYTGFKSSVAAAADLVKPTVAQTLAKNTDLPLSPPSSAGSDVDAAELEKRYTEDWNGQYCFAPIKEHIVSRGASFATRIANFSFGTNPVDHGFRSL